MIYIMESSGTQISGVGVLDRAAMILDALTSGPLTLAELSAQTGLPRPTAHRLASALAVHRLVGRDAAGRFTLGARLAELAGDLGSDRLLEAAETILPVLLDRTGESAMLFRPDGQRRLCVAAAERRSGLRDTVPVGTRLTMKAGSAAQVLLAWADPETVRHGLVGAQFSATTLAEVRDRGWAPSVAEREAGVASTSAPVRNGDGTVVAAVSISGPISRIGRSPDPAHVQEVIVASQAMSELLQGE